jgi:Arc/MetJ family transcription regulator
LIAIRQVRKEDIYMLRTNIELDEKLIKEAMKLTHKKTKKELVNYALKELVSRLKRKKLLELEGKVKWTGNLAEMRKSRL